jgi:hypothetical protein
MKKLLIVLLALTGAIAAAPRSNACDYRVVYAAPCRVSTCEVGRCSYCKTAFDRCGNRYHYTVTVVTYRDFYSDGSSQTYTRSFQS